MVISYTVNKKNLENIIQAFDYLNAEELSLVELHICGKFDSLDYFNKIESIISTRIKDNIFIIITGTKRRPNRNIKIA